MATQECILVNMPVNDRLRFMYWLKHHNHGSQGTEYPRVAFLKWLDTQSDPNLVDRISLVRTKHHTDSTSDSIVSSVSSVRFNNLSLV